MENNYNSRIKSKKVILFSRTFYPEGMGGGEISAFHIAKALSTEIEPIVCCLSEKTKKPIIEYLDGVKIYRFPWKKLKISKKLSNLDYAYLQMYRAAKKVIKKENPTYLHFLNFGGIFPLALFFNKYPKFATINGPLLCEFGSSHPDGKTCYNCTNKERFFLSFKKWGPMGAIYWIYNRYSQTIQKISLKKCNKLFAVSKAIKIMLIDGKIKENKIEVIHNPVKINEKLNNNLKEKLKISKEKKIILYAGRLAKDKGIHRTIKAIENIENVVFLIAGEKRNYYPKLKTLVKKLELEKKVIFLGFIDNSKIGKYFSIADLIVHPCSFYEPLSRMLIESTSYGLPIIATDMGGNGDIVKENINGFLVSNRKELKEKISLLINSPSLAKKMGKNSQKIATLKFAPEKIGKKIINEYIKIK
jgi:glycosyltransferase involved in cell wall biosynthesis